MTSSPSGTAMIAATIAALAACHGTGRRGSSPGPAPATAEARPGEASRPSPPPYPADAIEEGHARRLIAELMRDAGYRIVYDSPLAMSGIQATIDGLDPAAGIGFEYIARAEHNLDLTASEIDQLRAVASPRILVIEGGTAEAVEAATTAFLRSLPTAPP